jgi:hypothetical protein
LSRSKTKRSPPPPLHRHQPDRTLRAIGQALDFAGKAGESVDAKAGRSDQL